MLHEAGLGGGVGDEGGFAPNFTTNEEPLAVHHRRPCEAAGYKPGDDIMFAMDPASTEFYNAETGKYELKGEGRELTERRDGGLLGRRWSRSIRSSPSRTAWPRRTGTAGSS